MNRLFCFCHSSGNGSNTLASVTSGLVRPFRIYTRKSSEEGLDMEFNSLDAQREACEAYIASQRSEGWVQAFLNRPLEGVWPFLWLDATYVKLREGGRIVSMAVIVAVAVNTDGRREILGITVLPSEAEAFWAEFLRSLTRRGLRGVQLVISDAQEGLKAAARKVLGAGWQRCRVHFQRNLLARVGKTHKPVVSAVVKTVFAKKDRDQAHTRWREVADHLRDRFGDVAELMDEAEHDVLAYMAFDESLRSKPHSTNPLERVNKEIKRRTNVVGIFPNREAVIRLVGALMLEQNDEWAVSRRYMPMEKLTAICNDDGETAMIAAQ